jgi:fatty-acid peroxygenase
MHDRQGRRANLLRCRALCPPRRIAALSEKFHDELRQEISKWQRQTEIVLYDGLQPILTRAVCAWCGVPLPETEVGRRTRQLTAMFDAAGAFGPAHIRSRLARKQAERWAAGLIKEVRDGALDPAPETALRVIALHRDLEGNLLRPRIAAVELINVLRPTVAVSVYIVFCVHALHQYPAARLALHSGGHSRAAAPLSRRMDHRCTDAHGHPGSHPGSRVPGAEAGSGDKHRAIARHAA